MLCGQFIYLWISIALKLRKFQCHLWNSTWNNCSHCTHIIRIIIFIALDRIIIVFVVVVLNKIFMSISHWHCCSELKTVWSVHKLLEWVPNDKTVAYYHLWIHTTKIPNICYLDRGLGDRDCTWVYFSIITLTAGFLLLWTAITTMRFLTHCTNTYACTHVLIKSSLAIKYFHFRFFFSKSIDQKKDVN